MHKDRYIFVINQRARAVACVYDPDDVHTTTTKRTIFKTLDQDIKVDDLVIVPTSTRVGFTVVKVAEVDVDFDVRDDKPMAWIAGVFDKEAHDATLKSEAEAMKKIRDAEFRKQRSEIRDNMFGNNAAELNTLAIADMNGKTEAPPTPPAAPHRR